MSYILVVDDDDVTRTYLGEVLGNAGYSVKLAAGGKAALEQHQTQPAKLIILDILMPDMDGLETMRELRTRDPGVRVLGVSGIWSRFHQDYRSVALKLGMLALIDKPFTEEDLISQVRTLAGVPG